MDMDRVAATTVIERPLQRPDEPVEPVEPGAGPGDVLTVFAVLWAVANLFHIWGPSARATAVLSHVTTVGVTHVLIGVAAIAVLLRPRSLVRLGILAVLGPVSVWFEAPVLGSHWVVVALVDVAILLAIAVRGLDIGRVERAFLPAARLVLLGFYSFAAFAKLNHAFFTPRVSCGNYFFDELTGSLGIGLHSATAGWWSHLVPAGTAAIELAVPVLLLFRRTRVAGVVLGLVFHGLIALDQTHLLSDFSSVLNALFTLFLPASFAASVLVTHRSLSSSARDALRAVVVAGASVLLLVQWYGKGAGLQRLFMDGRAWAWVVFDVVVLVLVGRYVWHRKSLRADVDLRPSGWLWIVPALVLVNGLAPFLELRTAYAFNMYSNLETASGDSNHFIVTRTLPLTDYQDDRVSILESSDPNLQLYAQQRFDIPFLQLRDYVSHHRDLSLVYRRGGLTHEVRRASDDPALVEPVPSWQSKLFAFRSLDQTDPNRCQPSFLPAL
jgi:hypothetical protein